MLAQSPLSFLFLLDLDHPSAAPEDAVPAAGPTDSPLWLGHHTRSGKALPATPLLQTQALSLNPEELLPALTSPLHFVNTHFNGKGQVVGLESEIRSQESTLQSPIAPPTRPTLSRPESQESAGDGEDFVLLEQRELDMLKDMMESDETYQSSAPSASSHLQPKDEAS